MHFSLRSISIESMAVRVAFFTSEVSETLLMTSGNLQNVSLCGPVGLIAVAETLTMRTPMWACSADTLQKELLR